MGRDVTALCAEKPVSPQCLTEGNGAVSCGETARHKRREAEASQFFGQARKQSTVVEHPAAERHGADAAAVGRKTRPAGKAPHKAVMKAACGFSGMAAIVCGMAEQGRNIGFQQTVAFDEGQTVRPLFGSILRRFQTDGGLPFVGDVEAEPAQSGHGVEQTAAA